MQNNNPAGLQKIKISKFSFNSTKFFRKLSVYDAFFIIGVTVPVGSSARPVNNTNNQTKYSRWQDTTAISQATLFVYSPNYDGNTAITTQKANFKWNMWIYNDQVIIV